MIKHFLNTILLISFLTVFSVDSISFLFEKDSGVYCELSDVNDGEDSGEEEITKIESEAILSHNPNIELQAYFLINKNGENHFFIAKSYSLKIPTPPPELNS